MIATIIIGIFSVLFAFLARYEFVKFGLKISFFIIFIFLAFRYNFGNDYPGYLKDFTELNNIEKIDYFNTAAFHYEPGWLMLCRLCKPIGFFGMVAVLAAFNCLAYYTFIKKYVPRAYYWIAVFLYIFAPGFLLIQASAMRQCLAISIFIFSISFIEQKKPLYFTACILLASAFHSSAFILLPVYFIRYANKKIGNTSIAIITATFLSLFFLSKIIGSYLNDIVQSFFTRYEAYDDSSTIGTGLGIIYLSVYFVLILFYDKFQDKRDGLLFKIAIVSFIFIPLSLIMNIITRLGMYFGIATIAVYPILLCTMKRPAYRLLFLGSLCFITIYSFFAFFQSNLWKDAFGTYHSIFSATQFY